MATYTTNYNLHKIDLTDAPPDITVINANWDTIDAELKKVENKSSKSVLVETTLVATNWGGSIYTWSNKNITSATQIIELLPSQSITTDQLTALQSANIVGTSQTVGSITFTAYGEVPTIDIPVAFIVRGDV